jgi:hypothetical protein
MRSIQISLLAGAAMIACAGAAEAQDPETHVLSFELPGGGAGYIQYSGDVPPRLFVGESPAYWLLPATGPERHFAALERMAEELDQHLLYLLRRTATLSRGLRSDSDEFIQAYTGGFPEGGHSYSFVSTTTANGYCGRSVEITMPGDGSSPRIVRSFGQCSAGRRAIAPGRTFALPRSRHRPDTITASAPAGKPAGATHPAVVREAALR